MTPRAHAASRPVMVMAGGTGGHIFPGLAVAAELTTRGVPVVWLGAHDGLETQLVPRHGLPIETLSIGGMRGKGIGTLLRTPWRLLRAVVAARTVLARHAPRSVLSMGGYAAAPGGLAARLTRIPLVVHEQNSIPGVTNRILARFAGKVLCGFAGAFKRGEWVGNPVRREIAAVARPETRSANRDGVLKLLVLGGSQGAQSINVMLPRVLQRLPAAQRPQVWHQSGPKHLEKTARIYAAAGLDAQVDAFIDDMAAAYAWADFAVCRAGALTLAELCAVGLPAILVPFPAAVDDHQTHNAAALVDSGAALLVAEDEQFAERLGVALAGLTGGDDSARRARLLAMATAARMLAKPDAAVRIADACIEVAA
ncbi:MAG: undecaprenyldiphospho-muramoylpentapeptide beta-N-acetylglucosaminyltransferase [Rhodanobacter sp.]|nr:undecaprenyldiphospho-muramoylpentapeptide beta-N-acetylglucosaminyltransferase [Rhodanobacter sp.]